MPHYVYILYSPALDSFYKGRTIDIEKRLTYHNGGHEFHTSKGKPWILIWSAGKPVSREAIRLERKLKNLTRSRLLRLIQKYSEGIPCGSKEVFESL